MLPWQGEVQEGLEAPPPAYGAPMPEDVWAAQDVELYTGLAGAVQGTGSGEWVGRLLLLQQLGLIGPKQGRSVLQLGELCAAAATLAGGWALAAKAASGSPLR